MRRGSPIVRLAGRAIQRLRRALLGPNPYLASSNWEYQKRLVEPRLRPDSVVLDVGSGHLPCPRAAVLADFFPDELIHRTSPLVEDRPVVVCSVERLPFLAGAFDFAICSHVLEHVASPVRGAAELARVAREGYIETPAYGKDILVGTGSMHRWQVVRFGEELFFFEYTSRQREAHVSSPVQDIWMSLSHHPWQDYFWERQDLFNAWLCFAQGAPPRVKEHRVAGEAGASLPAWEPVPEHALGTMPSALTAAEIDLLERRLATPDGAQPMRFSGDAFASADGKVRYPVRRKRIFCEVMSQGGGTREESAR